MGLAPRKCQTDIQPPSFTTFVLQEKRLVGSFVSERGLTAIGPEILRPNVVLVLWVAGFGRGIPG